MRQSNMAGKVFFVLMPLLLSAAGCTATRPGAMPPKNTPGTGGGTAVTQSAQPNTQKILSDSQNTSRYLGVTKADYDEAAKEARFEVQPVNESDLQTNNNEGIFDSGNSDGVLNYATALFPDKNVERVRVKNASSGSDLFNLPVNADVGSAQVGGAAQDGGTVQQQAAGNVPVPPPGVRMDPNISPLAPVNASRQAKVAAIRQIAESKLGTPYIWGHNEDRGQYGFDCSNYTAYVYHHALGYSFSSMSRLQYSSVGLRVPVSDMSPGDLLTFDQGKHVGIYMGNGQMIQMGGGTAKCTYLPISPGSYWYRHLSAVKRMF